MAEHPGPIYPRSCRAGTPAGQTAIRLPAGVYRGNEAVRLSDTTSEARRPVAARISEDISLEAWGAELPSKAGKSGSYQIRRWREMDSNLRFRIRNNPFWLPPFGPRNLPSATKNGSFVPGTDGSNPSPSSRQSVSRPHPLSSVENPGFPRGCARLAWRPGRQRRAGCFDIAPTGGNISVGPYSSTAVPLMGRRECRAAPNEVGPSPGLVVR